MAIPDCKLKVWIYPSTIGSFYNNGLDVEVKTSGWHTYQVDYSGYFESSMTVPDSVDLIVNGKLVKQYSYHYPIPGSSYIGTNYGTTPRDLKVSYTNKQAKPNTKIAVKIVAHRTGCDDEVLTELSNSWTKTAPFGKASVTATKVSSSSAYVTASLSDYASTTSGETLIKFYMGSKLVKTMKTTTGKYSYKTLVNKKGAGKAKFKVVCVPNVKGLSGVSKTTSKTVNPQSNVRKSKYSKSPSSYDGLHLYLRMGKASASGKKVTVSGHWISSHIVTVKKGKFAITIYQDGKKIGSKTLSISKMKGNSTKAFKTTIKTKVPADLRDPYTRIEISRIQDII